MTSLQRALNTKTRPARNALLDAALGFVEKGIPVFPLRPGGKEPLTPHGFLDASTDPAQVRSWWRDPAANLAIPTGEKTVVVDIDPRNGGSLELLERLRTQASEVLPAHRTQGRAAPLLQGRGSPE